MKKILGLALLLSLIGFAACSDDDSSCDGKGVYCENGKDKQPVVQVAADSGKSIIEVDGKQYRDLNANGTVDPYEDWTLPVEERVADLVSKMSLDQKAGLLYETTFYGWGFTWQSDGSLVDDVKTDMQAKQYRVALQRDPGSSISAETMSIFNNNVQAFCESEPLGIPFVFCCDPSTGIGLNAPGTDAEFPMVKANELSPMGDWNFNFGFAAIDDPDYVKEIASMHADEYKACGFRMLLGPMCDPLGDPRWARSYDTMGTDPEKAGKLAKAYIQGLQQTKDGSTGQLVPGVAATLKHFPGAGTNVGGMDSHSSFGGGARDGEYALFKAGNFNDTKEAFKEAFEAGPLCVMPCYSMYMTNWDDSTRTFNSDFEKVGASYEMTLMWDILREECEWDGMVTSDWSVAGGAAYGFRADELAAKNPTDLPQTAPAFSIWDDASNTYRQSYIVYKYWKAGGHQFGMGSAQMWIDAVEDGFLSETDLNEPAGKVLEMMFKLGVFENPYVDPSKANAVATSHQAKAFESMKKAVVLVKNEDTLPLDGATLSQNSQTVYFDGADSAEISNSVFAGAQATEDMSEADYIILRVAARWGTYSGLAGGVPLSFQANVYSYNYDEWRHYTAAENEATGTNAYLVTDGNQAASIAQAQKIKDAIAAKKAGAKLILCVFARRPFVFDADIDTSKIDALIVEFGIFDKQLLEVIFSTDGFKPKGKLPFNIPSSDASVEAAYEDGWNDEANPLFKYGTSLSY